MLPTPSVKLPRTQPTKRLLISEGSRGSSARPFSMPARMVGQAKMRKLMILMALVALAACQRDAAIPTTEENLQLDEAANLLDEAPEDLDSIDDSGLNGLDNAGANSLL